ncbi:MAG: flagellar motor stator protein MotA, partial [Burkholderiaceae bacterium]|nr:flagellar motor stator protein MotA [Burkholderiaceae bacterium]
TDYLRMMLGGSLDVIQIESLMEQELDVHHQEGHIPVASVTNVGDGLPAFGIVAAVMGVVHTMGSIGLPPAELGKLIGAALVGTFLGILLAYAFVSPVAKVLEQNLEADTRSYMAVKAILIASLNNFPPAAAVEFGRKVLFTYQRPTFAELDYQKPLVRKVAPMRILSNAGLAILQSPKLRMPVRIEPKMKWFVMTLINRSILIQS